MEKKIVAIGNSLGLVIDKSLRAQLGIRSTTVVRMTSDGIAAALAAEPFDRLDPQERSVGSAR